MSAPLGQPPLEQRRLAAGQQRAGAQVAEKVEIRQTIFGAVSPDGLRWTPLAKPLRDLGTRTLDGEYYVIYDEDKISHGLFRYRQTSIVS